MILHYPPNGMPEIPEKDQGARVSENLYYPAEFDIVKTQSVPILNLDATLYRHRHTGALHFHLSADHSENVFLVGFRTVPTDSTGVAHILEHTVLCGSEKYPVRDPFFMMIRRSLNTFMNAFTSADWTAYPFATQNRKDYFNLLDVYLDAAFFPRLDPLDFCQEGHRVEFETPTDPTSALTFKGVVFNEMKGAMGSAPARFYQAVTRHLFEHVTYHFNSGGDPAEIPDLSYEQLKAFHALHYHPSNAVFITFGSIGADEIQHTLHDRVLRRFEALDHTIAVPLETRFKQPKYATEPYPVEEGSVLEKKTAFFLAWLLPENTHLPTVLRAELLTGLLMDNSASPLRDYLETTTLGTHPASLSGLETDTREMVWVCGLEGAEPESAAQFEHEVLDLLERVARDGVDPLQIEAMIHQMELSHREIQGGGYPYGLHLILSTLPAFIHRADPFASLDIDEALADLRCEAAEPGFVGRQIRSFLLDNPHRLHLTMCPDPTLNAAESGRETARLAALSATLEVSDREAIIRQTEALLARQAESQADDSILPRVGIEDIPAWIDIPCGTTTALRGTTCTHFATTTRGLIYQDIILPLPPLDEAETDLLGFFSTCWNELGAGDMDYRARQARAALVSGGMGASTLVHARPNKKNDFAGYLCLSGKGLERNHRQFSDLMQCLLSASRFDEYDHIRDLYLRVAAQREQAVIGNGHQLAMLSACAAIHPLAALVHRLRGLAGIAAMKAQANRLDEAHVRDLALRMAQMYRKFTEAGRQLLLIGEAENQATHLATLDDVFGASSEFAETRFEPGVALNDRDQIWIAPAPVHFCAKVYPTVCEDHPDDPALNVLALILKNGFLHRAIREQGGAYGGGALQDGKFGLFKFYSYRDPRLLETFDDFDRALDWLHKTPITDQMLEEAILGVVSGLDKPGAPADEARRAFYDQLSGVTPSQRRERRAQVLAVTRNDILRVGQTYLRPETARISAVTPEEGARLFDAQVYDIRSLAKGA